MNVGIKSLIFSPPRFCLALNTGKQNLLSHSKLADFSFYNAKFFGVFFGNALKYTQVLYREESQANPYYGPICIVSANENNGQEIINRIDFSFLIHTLEVQILKSHLLYGQLDRTSALIQLYNSNPNDRITFSWPLVDRHGR